jgi:oligopeptide transport system substrate-binding protein
MIDAALFQEVTERPSHLTDNPWHLATTTLRYDHPVRWLVIAVAACGLPDGDYFGAVSDHVDASQFRWCNSGEPDHLDPATSSSVVSSPLVNALFDGLTSYGMDGLPRPSLATHWEISDDLRTYRFDLRNDARWSNGRHITAYDVAYQMIRVAEPVTASPNGDNIGPIKNVPAYLAGRVFVMRRDASPYHAGDVVELAGDGNAPDVAARQSTSVLALRDLGSAESSAYARVPAGETVELMMTTGGRSTLPSPDGAVWAYVFWHHDVDGVFGWVPARELDREPNADAKLAVRRVTAKDRPGLVASDAERAADDTAVRPIVNVTGRDVAVSPDALGIRVIDDHTLEIECSDPTPYVIPMTANRAMRPTPIEAVSRSPRHWAEPGRIVSSGPMTLAAWIERGHLELVRSPTYWDPGDVHIDRLIAYSMDDQAASANYYYVGDCDALATNMIPSTYLPAVNGELRGRPYKDYVVAPWLGVYWAWINTKRLSNRHLRRALALAIDRTQIPRFTHGNEIPSAQLTPGTPIAQLSDDDLRACGVHRGDKGVALVMETGVLCYVPPPGLDYDLAAAKREIALAKQELGEAFPVKLNYRYNAGAEAHKQIAEYLQSAWRQIGVDVEVQAQEFNSLLDDTRSGNYDIARLGNVGTMADTESEFLPLFHCDSPDNRAKYCNPAFERLMTEARPIRDRKARNAKLREAESVMIEDAPLIPLYVYTQKHLVKPYVKDLAINLIDQPPLWRVRIDPSWRP